MKKGQVLRGIVEKVGFPNKGIVLTEEGKCIVKSVLPGQKITLTVQKVRNGRGEGRLLHIEENSPLEIESPCPHFGVCGGCTYISLPYEEQLKLKEAQVYQLLNSVLTRQEKEWKFEGIKKWATAIRWNFLLAMNLKMALLLLACIKEEAFMILFR